MGAVFKVYKITNEVNGKFYIGVTKRPMYSRIMSHKLTKKGCLYNPIQEFGVDNFSFLILATFDNKKDAYQEEKRLILQYKSYDQSIGYNIAIGRSHSEKTKNKIRKTWSEKDIDVARIERARRLGLSKKGTKASDIARKRMSESHLGKPSWNKGKKLSEEHRKKLSLAKLGNKLSEEHRKNISKSHLEKRD